MHSTPYVLKAYDKAYRNRRMINDEEMWIMGKYVMSALSTVLGNMFTSKKTNVEYIKEPFMAKIDEQNKLTQEEIDNREIQKLILYEEQWAKASKEKGLAETIIK